jgi:hypothetical protein
LIDSKVLNAGSKIAYLAAIVYLKNTEQNYKSFSELLENIDKLKIIANGTHTKFLTD